MNTSTIEQYVDNKNAFRKIFSRPALSLLSAVDRQELASCLDADMSPENLTCDGEIRGAALQKKAAFLNRAAAELVSIDPNVVFADFY